MFATIIALMPNDFLFFQADYNEPSAQSQEVIDFFSANNITTYTNTWSFNITYQGMKWNETGFGNGHRIEFHWIQSSGSVLNYPHICVRHAYPSPLGDWWLWWNKMSLEEPYLTKAGAHSIYLVQGDEYGIEKHQLINLQQNSNSSYFIVSDGEVISNFVVMNFGNYSTLSDSWDAGFLHVLSSYEIDWDAMKPSAFTLVTQLIFFQNPDLGFPTPLDEILGYGFSIAFSITIAIIIYTIITRLIPIITGGVEN